MTFDDKADKHIKNNAKHKNVHKNRQFLIGDMNKIPLAKNTVNEIWLENVLGDPRVDNIILALEEFNRVLKNNGKVIMFEYYSPSIIFNYFNNHYAEIDYGLKKTIYQGDEMVEELLRLGMEQEEIDRRIKDRWGDDNNFLLILEKTKNDVIV